MGRIAVTHTALTSAQMSTHEVTVGQTFTLAVSVEVISEWYRFNDAPTLGHSLLSTSRRGQTDYSLKKEAT